MFNNATGAVYMMKYGLEKIRLIGKAVVLVVVWFWARTLSCCCEFVYFLNKNINF